jgi:threonine dehydratase
MRCRNLERLAGGRKLFLKAETFQTTGSFKFRGALNAVLALPAVEADAGVVTHSSGNHGAALAKAAAVRGIRATIVMPEGTPKVKEAAARAYGADVVSCPRAGGMAAREAAAAAAVSRTGGGTLIPPYNNAAVMAGQGTIALELLAAVPNLDAIVVPISGGGLASGVAVAAKALSGGRIRVIAAEPRGRDSKPCAADAAASKARGEIVKSLPAPETCADGLRGQLGSLTWPIVRDLVDAVVVVSEKEIIDATRLVMERVKVVVEPSGAAALAAVLSPEFSKVVDGDGKEGKDSKKKRAERVGVVLSGGNVDLEPLFAEMMRSGGYKVKK